MRTVSPPRTTTCEPASSGTARKRWPQTCRVVDEGLVADHGAVGEGGDGRLEVQHLRQRYGDHPAGAHGLEVVAQLGDALGVGATTHADPHDTVVLEDVAAVEGAGVLDPFDPVSLLPHGLLGRGDLRAPLSRRPDA